MSKQTRELLDVLLVNVAAALASGKKDITAELEAAKDEAEAKLDALVQAERLEARIDEAKKIYTNYIPTGTLVGKAVLRRIRRYKAQLQQRNKQ